MMHTTQHLVAEIEAVAKIIGKAPSTVGEKAGQGGRFYDRLVKGKRVWPETAAKVLSNLAAIKAEFEAGADSREASHGNTAPQVQGVGPR